jgi:RepB DNA-primase from phage plasmid
VTVAIDEATVRQFLEIISPHAVMLAKSAGRSGVLQLCCLSPHDGKMMPSRHRLDDVETIVKAAVGAANAELNVYVEGRALRAGLRGNVRGSLDDTEFVLAMVVDADHDKGKGGNLIARPSLTIETSVGNYHHWCLLSAPISARRAKTIGDAIRAATGSDQATGVVTQCYRVPGTPNFPSKAKQARGRVTIEPTRIVEWTGKLWDPDDLLTVHKQGAPTPTNGWAQAHPSAMSSTSAATNRVCPKNL